MSAQAWAVFRNIRIFIFVLSAIGSIAWTIIYAVFLSREWNVYDDLQRGMVIGLVILNGIASIFLYLMIVVQFHLWLDAIRISGLLVFQLGGTIVFAIFRKTLPCNAFGPKDVCELAASVVIFGSWAVSGLLFLYLFYLSAMSHVERPPRPKNPESTFIDQRSVGEDPQSPSIDADMWPSEKHDSFSPIVESYAPRLSYGASLHHARPYANAGYGGQLPASPYATPLRSLSLSPVQMPGRAYFAGRNIEPSPSPMSATGSVPPFLASAPFAVPISRPGTSLSVASYSSYRSNDSQQARLLPQPSVSMVAGGIRRYDTTPPPYPEGGRFAITDDKQTIVSLPVTPLLLSSPRTSRESPTASLIQRGAPSIRSMSASLHPSISPPWSPVSPNTSPSPRPSMLPSPPPMTPFLRNGEGTWPIPPLSRYGTMTSTRQQSAQEQDARRTPFQAGDVRAVSHTPRPIDPHQWKQVVLQAAHGPALS